jgi:hypothetical protein
MLDGLPGPRPATAFLKPAAASRSTIDRRGLAIGPGIGVVRALAHSGERDGNR